jgi:hypothetical protein
MPDPEMIDPELLDERLRTARRRGHRRLVMRRTTIALTSASLAFVAVALPTLVFNKNAPGAPAASGSRRPSSTVLASLKVPRTYAMACANEPLVCVGSEHGNVPHLLKRPLHFPVVAKDGVCPATPGAPVDSYTSYFVGDALGKGPVRVAIGDRGDLRRGQAQLGSTAVPGWFALETLWFAMPNYDGPFVVRGERLGGSGPINVDGSATNPSPLVVPPGPTANTQGGIRVAPVSTWVKSPGCYAWQVDGLSFSYVIVVDATPYR